MFTNAAVSHMIEYRYTCKRKLIHYISILLHRGKSTLSKYMIHNPQLIYMTTYFLIKVFLTNDNQVHQGHSAQFKWLFLTSYLQVFDYIFSTPESGIRICMFFSKI